MLFLSPCALFAQILDEVKAQLIGTNSRNWQVHAGEVSDAREVADCPGDRKSSSVYMTSREDLDSSPRSFSSLGAERETSRTVPACPLRCRSDPNNTASPSFYAVTGNAVDSCEGLAIVAQAAESLLSGRRRCGSNEQRKLLSDGRAHCTRSASRSTEPARTRKSVDVLSRWTCDACKVIFQQASRQADYSLMASAAAWRARSLLHAGRWEEVRTS